MSSLSSSPQIVKGAFVRFDKQTPQGRVIEFQYNPEKLYRKLEARTEAPSCQKEKYNAERIKLPLETITFTTIIDAADNLERPDHHRDVVEHGIYPLMSALELLLYPDSGAERRSNLFTRLFNRSDMQSLTLFVWGNKRILPVRLIKLNISEEMFDPGLISLRAYVDVTMHVLNGADLHYDQKGLEYWEAHLSTKAAMAGVIYNHTPARVLGML